MPPDTEQADENTKLLGVSVNDRRLSAIVHQDDVASLISSHISKDEQALSANPVGERLPYNDYTTIDWLHDLVKSSYRYRSVHNGRGLRDTFRSMFESCSGWIAAALIGIFTAIVAFLVDIATATASDWKFGYCKTNYLANRESCCTDRSPLLLARNNHRSDEACSSWHPWRTGWYEAFGIYVGWALAFGVLSSSLTMLTRSTLPAASSGQKRNIDQSQEVKVDAAPGKSIYLAAGSGIPEIKTILSGFVIPHILDFKVLVVKAIGAVFAVSTGMCLGKEGPFVHISTCVSNLVAKRFSKYRDNDRKMREILSAGCASGLSVAFGAPIGGVLFSYEEISTYFPRKVLWRAFFCSLWAAMILKALNPTGTGKLVLFETNYGTSYSAVHYLVFVFLGIVGGLWGGVFCKCNFIWSRTFRKLDIIKNHPVFEVFLVVLATGLLQYPNPMTREPGDVIIKNLLQDCRSGDELSWICQQELESGSSRGPYIGWLIYGTLVKLVLTIITFGCKVPSGIIIPALDAGAFFGRLVGQALTNGSSSASGGDSITAGQISPGIFAMVGAAAFLAGVSRMTISLCVIMFELTGELEYIVPHMIAILVAKWVADALEEEGVYDLAQTVLGHPFLDPDHAMNLVQKEGASVETLIPPEQTMREITVSVGKDGCVRKDVLVRKLERLKERGLMDAGLVIVQDGTGLLRGYLAEGELDFGLHQLGHTADLMGAHRVRLLVPDTPRVGDGETPDDITRHNNEFDVLDLSSFVDKTPLTINAQAPMEYAVEMFGKLGLRHLCVLEDGTSKLVGVIIKKRMVVWLEGLKHSSH